MSRAYQTVCAATGFRVTTVSGELVALVASVRDVPAAIERFELDRRVLVRIDDDAGEVSSLSEVFAANEFDDVEREAIVRCILEGREYVGGGGAAPLFSLEAVS